MTIYRYALPFILLVANAAHAQEAGMPLWEYGLAGGVAVTPAYPGSTEKLTRALALPFFIYRGEVFRVDRGGIGARVVNQKDFEVDIGFSASLPASSKDVEARSGMEDLGTLVEFGPRLKYVVARPTPFSRVRVELPLRAVLEFDNGVRGQGAAFEPQISYESRNIAGGWGLGVSASVVFGDQSLNQYFYSVPARFATANRPQYDAQAGLISSRVGLNFSKELSSDARIFIATRYDSYAGAKNVTSPLMQQSNSLTLGLGFTWTLGRSEARAVR
jgi:outer membrane scaffolding protein for murein synthesis (MipA/OmpV family)